MFNGCLSSLNWLGLDMAIKWKDVKEKVLQNPKVKFFYDELEPEFAFAREIAQLRETTGLSQQDFSDKADIKQPQLATLESGKQSPRLETLSTLDSSPGCSLEARFVTDKSSSKETISSRVDQKNVSVIKSAKKARTSKKLISPKSDSKAINKKHKSVSKPQLTIHSC
jgi:DNA-binding XRE family transcriptional regulator